MDEVKYLVNEAFSIHEGLSLIEKWSMRIGQLNGLDNETERGVQELLNHMCGHGFRLGDGWLHYSLPVEAEDKLTMRLEVQETNPILDEVKKKGRERSLQG